MIHKKNRKSLAEGLGVTVFFAYFFYRSLWALLPMSAVGILYMKQQEKIRIRRDKTRLLQQFKECIFSAEASLKAGYAVENAFLESRVDMKAMFGENSEMVKELDILRQGLLNRIPIEQLFLAFGNRSEVEEIREFAEVFVISKRNGGNLSQMLETTGLLIHRKLELQEEIDTLLASKRFEQKIMNVMPFLIVTYLNICNPGYFDMFYHNLRGVFLMTVVLGVYVAAYGLSESIFRKAYE